MKTAKSADKIEQMAQEKRKAIKIGLILSD